MNIQCAILLISIFSTLSYAKTIDVTCNNGLKIQGEIKNEVTTFSFFDNFQFDNDKPIIFGEMTVINDTQDELKFGTQMLEIEFNKLTPVRSYKQTIASEVIDSSFKNVKARSSFDVNLYWAPKLVVGDKVESIVAFCRDIT